MFIAGTQEKAGRTNRLVNSMKYFSCALLVVAGQTHTQPDGEALLALQSLLHPGCSEEVKAWQQARYTPLCPDQGFCANLDTHCRATQAGQTFIDTSGDNVLLEHLCQQLSL